MREETGLDGLEICGEIETIDWYFRFRGKLIHKICHFYLMKTESDVTSPQRTEGITACRWMPIVQALETISYANARSVLRRAQDLVAESLARR